MNPDETTPENILHFNSHWHDLLLILRSSELRPLLCCPLSQNPRCSSNIVIVLLLCSVHVTPVARLSLVGRGIPPLRFSHRFLIFP